MKKLAGLILLVCLSAGSFAQKFPTRQTNSSTSTIVTNQGAGAFNRGIVVVNFLDTTAANQVTYMKNEPYIIITTSDHSFWRRNAGATQWIKMSGAGGGDTYSTVNIYNDTTLVICSNGTNLCDTSYVTNVGAMQTVNILNDSTLEVCGTLACDTLNVPGGNVTTTGPGVIYYGKNVSGDSTILQLSNGTRYAAKDSAGKSSWLVKSNGYDIYRVNKAGVGGDSLTGKFTVIDNNLTAAARDTAGIFLANNTDADISNPTRVSPPVVYKASANGYGRTRYKSYSNGTNFNIDRSMDDGVNYTNLFSLSEGYGNGYLQLGGNVFGSTTSALISMSAPYAYFQYGNISGGNTFASGTGGSNRVDIVDNTTNNGAIATVAKLNISGSMEAYAGTTLARGIWYHPNIVAANGLTHRAIELEQGDNLLGSISGNTIIGGNVATSKLTVIDNTLTNVQNDALGISLVNNTAATALDGMKMAPPLVWKSNEWTGSASREVRWRAGPDNAIGNGNFSIEKSINGGASYSTMFQLKYGVSNPAIVLGANYFGDDVLTGNIQATGQVLANTFEAANSSGISYSGDRVRSHMATTFTIGTNTVNYFVADPVYNNTSGTNVMRGFYYNPTVGSFAGSSHYGFWNTSGHNLFGSVSGSTSVGPTSSIPDSRIFQVVSTTKASSPFPVMTAAEKLAIASPNIGDHVYQSDGTEGVYVYKSSGWTFAY